VLFQKISESCLQLGKDPGRKAEMIELQTLMESGELPLRITHNDTKLNNILYDNEDRALAVIDLDTVMPGIVHFDYGDAIRTIANEGDEDSEDIAEVVFSETHFSAFTIGYLEKTARLLTRKEKETLFLAPMTMTFMMGLRFLTDYFNGDRYFKTGKSNHNLVRARAQFKFLEELDRNHEFIVNLIEQNAF
jgi:Ser/Thr protein kinase RdoA (MazF antagonist)